MWEPFAGWVSTAHPEDAAVMYEDETYSGPLLTEQSIRLWEKRSRDYVELKTAKMVEIAESFMEARNAYDTEKAMSLLADDGVTALLMYNNAMDPDMPALRLNRAQLALALEAERLYEIRYEHFECGPTGEAAHLGPRFDPGPGEITCTYLMDAKLRQIEGYPPKVSGFGLRFREGRINHLSFPWLSVSFPSSLPTEGARFVQWLDRKHPEAGERIFETVAQERVLNLTQESVDLLPGYLQEYERSRKG